MNKISTNQKGFSSLVIVVVFAIIIVVLVGVFVFKNENIRYEVTELPSKSQSTTTTTFEKLPESQTAPTEVNDTVVEELDNLFKSIDSDSSGDTLDDLVL